MESMATAVENAYVILICMTKKYKESPNCRAEAEYTSVLKKNFIPLILDANYRPDGWLGIMLGAKLYFKFGQTNYEAKLKELFKEVGHVVKTLNAVKEVFATPPKIEDAQPSPAGLPLEKWTLKDVVEWLEKDEILSEFKQIFEAERITGIALLELTAYIKNEKLPKVLKFLIENYGKKKSGEYLVLINALRNLAQR